jgi:S-layer family protein
MKKVLSLVLVIAMVLSSMSFAFAAKFEDVADTDYAEAIETLTALGVVTGYEDGTYRPEKTITRAEMAKLMVELLGYGDLVAGSKSNFSDTQGHWADSYIGLAAGRGIVVGTGNGKFDPERTVSYDEVLTMLVRGLGYTDSSNELKNMTWPTNFKVKAAELNITKNVNINATGADRGGVAQAMYNALDQQIVKVNSDGDIVKEFRTVGTRTDVPVNLITRVATLKDTEIGFEHITPGDKNYAGDKVDLSGYLFQTVEAYYNKNKDKEIVYVGDVVSLTYKDTFEDTITQGTSTTPGILEVGDYTFYVDSATVSYNNVEEAFADLDGTNLEDATITVVLEDDQTRVRDKAYIKGIIVEKANSYVQIEEEYKDDATKIDEIYLPVKSKKVDSVNLIVKGDAEELSDIKADDIVAVYAPLGDDATVEATDKLTLVVSRKTIDGKVTGTASDAYYIDRTKYSTNDGLNIGVLDIGDAGTFYLDDNGKIIAFEGESEGSKTYAVVEETLIGRYELNSAGTKATITTAPKVKLNNSSNETITYSFDLDLEVSTAGVVSIDSTLAGLFAITQPLGTFNEGRIELSNTFVTGNKLVSYSLDSKSNAISTFGVAGRAITNVKTDSKSFVLASNVVLFNNDGDVISESKLGSDVTGFAVYQNSKIVALYATSITDPATQYYAYITSVQKDSDNDGDEIQRLTAYINGTKNEKLFTTDKNIVTNGTKQLYLLDVNDDGDVKVSSVKTIPSTVVTASAVNVKSGEITIVGSGVRYFEQGTTTIIERENAGTSTETVKVLGSLNAISTGTNATQFKVVYVGTSNVIGFIIIDK